MIVPRSRLLFWAAAVTLPLALLAAAVPDTTVVCMLLAVGFGAVVAADAWRSRRTLAGIGIEVPPIVRMSRNRAGKFDVRIRNESERQLSLRIVLDLPTEIRPAATEVETVLPSETQWSRLVWQCTPGVRGNYKIQSAFVEGVSSFGFWAPRRRLPVNSEIRVYPNLLSDRKSLAALFMRRGVFGIHTQRQIGKGRDFEKLREYVPGDSFGEIHWKATARRGRPITKVFQIERTQEVYVAIDASRLSGRQAGADSVLERLVTAALVLGLAAEQQGDLFGLLTFSDRIERFIRASNGKAHYSQCRDALYTLQPRVVTPDFDELWTFLRLRLRRRALVVFLTSLDDPALAESFMRNVNLIRLQHVVLVNMIRQPGVRPLFTDPKISHVDDIYKHLGGHLQWQRLRRLQKALERRGVQFSLLESERLSAELVSQYLSIKQRQLL
jgi:uncharacterized protein (DUF58 family)